MAYTVNIDLSEEAEEELIKAYNVFSEAKGVELDLDSFSKLVFIVGLASIKRPMIYNLVDVKRS